MSEEFMDEIDRSFLEHGEPESGPIRLAKVEQRIREIEAANRGLRARIAELEASAWQPIETAPKDGSYVDLWVGTVRIPDCRWLNGAWREYAPNDFETVEWCRIEGEPTYWMREPNAPEALARLEGK